MIEVLLIAAFPPDGSRTFEVALWNGSDWETVIKDSIKAE